ncbi:uncharacterized protein LOC117342512 [Pecten maximus]|uniref:uncharacterized protein LOC117342512 n=1 Tax=Pecten maximus TaxID=6579 RepID=UPI001457FB17|nr:uncharacterized protein LOC117342512 [Pecten maximus]
MNSEITQRTTGPEGDDSITVYTKKTSPSPLHSMSTVPDPSSPPAVSSPSTHGEIAVEESSSRDYFLLDSVSTSRIDTSPRSTVNGNLNPTKSYPLDNTLPTVSVSVMKTSAYPFKNENAGSTTGVTSSVSFEYTSTHLPLSVSSTSDATPPFSSSSPSAFRNTNCHYASVMVTSSSCRLRPKCPCRHMTKKGSAISTKETKEAVAKQIEKTKIELTVNKSMLSSTIRKKTSAVDSRLSASLVGYVAGFILVAIAIIIIIQDIVGYRKSPDKYTKTRKKKKKKKKKSKGKLFV